MSYRPTRTVNRWALALIVVLPALGILLTTRLAFASLQQVATPASQSKGRILTKPESQQSLPEGCATFWSIVPSPNPAHANLLYAVDATSPTDVWAAGFVYADGVQRTLIEHSDGESWTVVPSPNANRDDHVLRG